MAVPFTPDGSPYDSPIHQLLQIEYLLKELLTLLRWTGWTAAHGFPASFGNAVIAPPSMLGNNSISEERYYRQVLESVYIQAQRLSAMPDVVVSCSRSAGPRNANGNGNGNINGNDNANGNVNGNGNVNINGNGNATPRIENALLRIGNATAGDGGNGNATSREARVAAAAPKPQNRTVTLQVELCPECYYDGNERKLKVVGVTRVEKKTADGEPIVEEEDDTDLMRSLHHAGRSVERHHRNHVARQQQQQQQQQDGGTLHIQERGLEVIRRLGSVIQRDSFETSVLTAIFVIVGWKMLIKN